MYVLFSNNLVSIPIMNKFAYSRKKIVLVLSLKTVFLGSLRLFVDIGLSSLLPRYCTKFYMTFYVVYPNVFLI